MILMQRLQWKWEMNRHERETPEKGKIHWMSRMSTLLLMQELWKNIGKTSIRMLLPEQIW